MDGDRGRVNAPVLSGKIEPANVRNSESTITRSVNEEDQSSLTLRVSVLPSVLPIAHGHLGVVTGVLMHH